MGATGKNGQDSKVIGETGVESQVSDQDGITNPQGVASPIGLDNRYLLNSKTGEEIDGIELVKLANQGKLTRTMQSELDKVKAEHKSATERLSALEREREELLIRANIAEQRGSNQQTPSGESDDDFLNLFEEQPVTKPVAKPTMPRNGNENSSQTIEIINEVKTIRGELQEFKAERKMTADQAELERIANYDTEQTFVELKSELSDIEDTVIRQIIRAQNTAEKMRIEFMNKKLEGDEGWADDLVSARQLNKKALKMYADAVKQQETISIKKENDASVLGGSGTDAVSLPEGFKISRNPEEAMKQWKEISEQNKKKSLLQRRQVH
jgi:hypothetical protein